MVSLGFRIVLFSIIVNGVLQLSFIFNPPDDFTDSVIENKKAAKGFLQYLISTAGIGTVGVCVYQKSVIKYDWVSTPT